MTEPTLADWLSALQSSHDRLAALVTPMTTEQVAGPSYASEWSIAQVLSHLGSGADIFALFLESALDGKPAPGMEQFQAIWDEWNAKPPQDQARDGIATDGAFLDRIAALDDTDRERCRLELFGNEARLTDLARMRLGEHALHSWDILVEGDAQASLAGDATTLLVDHLGQLVDRAGKAPDSPVDVIVTTDEPSRSFRLTGSSAGASLASIDSGAPADGAALHLPAEALIRLVYGRLDPDHTPPVKAKGIDLDVLRRMFPGV
jgi:uncharacterized protein (TIGR03083 family)